MKFVDSILYTINKTLDFKGRAARSEYWYFFAFYILASIVSSMADVALGTTESGIVNLIVTLLLFLPSLAVAIRRMHDIERRGWWVLIGIIPLVGWGVFIYFMVKKGTEGRNEYGADPLGA